MRLLNSILTSLGLLAGAVLMWFKVVSGILSIATAAFIGRQAYLETRQILPKAV